MYYPILRGRQNELLAVKELLNASLLSDKIIPIIEPVKLSPTLVNTIKAFSESKRDIILIRNPKVGSFEVDAKNTKNAKYKEALITILGENKILRGLIVDKETPIRVEKNASKRCY